jgi:porphobilinogen synthase
MTFPDTRLRRLRLHPAMRNITRETQLQINDLIMPYFIVPGSGIRKEISAMPGQYHWSVDTLLGEVDRIAKLGIQAILLFGLPAQDKTEAGSEAHSDHAVVQQALRAIKAKHPELLLITDVCLCHYTQHGHCGPLCSHGTITTVDNDATLEVLQKVAVSHAKAGADMVAPSGMMDGVIAALRGALDEAGFTHTAIMSYAVKFASSFYGPFREAANSSPGQGDRKSYQMDPANIDEALREAEADVNEGADWLMVKPAQSFLDVIRAVKENFALPLACYQVSGEYSMIKAAAEKGWINEQAVVLESLTSMKRAGATAIITYFSPEVSSWLQD